jgi:ABC-2 type transport system permease protein
MNQFPILVKREFWEHRNIFVILPAIVAAFMVLLMVGMFVAVDIGGMKAHVSLDMDTDSEAYEFNSDDFAMDDALGMMFSKLPHMSEGERESSLDRAFLGLAVPFYLILSLVVFIYLVGSLYEDRKDRSILFWKSLPVSDFSTVGVKIFTALIAVPVVYFICIVVVQLALLIVATLAAIGHDVAIWDHLVAPSDMIGRWVRMIGFILVDAIWSLPFFGWVILVSAFATSVPLAWILGIPIALSIIEMIFTSNNAIVSWWFAHAKPVNVFRDGHLLGVTDLFRHLLSVDALVGVVVGVVFVGVAIWLRGRGDEI